MSTWWGTARKERKGKERKGKERKGKERKGKKRKFLCVVVIRQRETLPASIKEEDSLPQKAMTLL
eukprot:1138859-Pelagomonas_calceolata.AAC.10